MKEATKITLMKFFFVLLPILLALVTALIVSGDSFSFSFSSEGVSDSGTHGGSGCQRPYP